MRMYILRRIRQFGSALFVLMWIPFACVFAGMASEFGSFGQQLVARFPALLTPQPSGVSSLTEISVILTFGLMLMAMAFTFGSPLLMGLVNRSLRRNGERARARIIAAQQTGTFINENPEVRFTLEVQPQGGMPFQAEANKIVAQINIPQYQVGAMVPVRYDPNSFETTITDESI